MDGQNQKGNNEVKFKRSISIIKSISTTIGKIRNKAKIQQIQLPFRKEFC